MTTQLDINGYINYAEKKVIEALDGIIRSCVGKVSARILRILIGECSIKMGFRKINSINRGRFSADSQVGTLLHPHCPVRRI